ncbi:MAG TPA: Spy/CpxP family protein refolding chaperone [Phenylobacterium sp.]|uniref:Spy/CpxP family protein refolding chaperone n=1 Tax=Phenylobacterium sp. TaxID=1871053 RepID=UPI002D43468F|nr:Spy/CpxP family protein refolding chaperone [Phenylobacterium sp.]HZZ70560.1 Spy/CpxP family protein refolding chaperone [Phenylobacterium sp.]
MSRLSLGVLAGAAFALTAAAAYAQAEPPVPPAPPAAFGDHPHVERHMVVRHGRDQAEHLRTMLQLKPSQEPALAAYLAAVSPARHHEAIVEMSDHGDAKTTPQRLADLEARLAEQTAQGRARIEATRKFYDQLEPSQKKVFDEMPMLMIGPMGPMMNMGDMKVMVNMQGLPPMPPLPALPPVPPVPRL